MYQHRQILPVKGTIWETDGETEDEIDMVLPLIGVCVWFIFIYFFNLGGGGGGGTSP